MKIWDKGFSIDKRIETFTIGKDRELDVWLAPFDILGSMAHSRMLHKIGLLDEVELQQLLQGLKDIYAEVEKGEFVIEEGIEDVHSQVELMLTRKLGDVGKKVHSGRSRNDQVLLDLRLYIRQEIETLVHLTERLFNTLIKLSEKHKEVLLPGYTHTQVAMPSSFGLWFGAYAESLVDDLTVLQAAYKVSNQNPLGSAAGYGSSFPLDRSMTTQLLGFECMSYNVVYAQMGRGKVEKTVSFALASIAATLGKLSADVCQYMSQNFGFVTLPDHLTTGSSIMPHKKNPDVFELIRAKSNKLQALPNEISLIITNLTSGYHRDLQLVKESFLPAFEDLKDCLSISEYMLNHVQVNTQIMDDEKYTYLFSVEAVNQEVLNGVPFRDAYKKVGAQIADGTYQPMKELKHTHEGSLGNLCNDKITNKMKEVQSAFKFDQVHIALDYLLKD
ncbi:argininosuccinate lyase [Catalinimonas alkaloidigena]|uniref:argininosuccinate lyase n=1 Tax=Catalinimonas alkaloidigena TaxID=1075417 RepID=UPI0024069EEB|nr:argininosuccinate lyase [Catalinimonas alkaloidigena]MDF9797057.1 argininosuccinate lyase [Catalinimonas alkaloidigena]